MRILIFSQYYLPEPITKMHVLAKSLIKDGHTVQVLTAFPNYPEGKIYPGYKQTFLKEDALDGVKITRVPIYPYRGSSTFLRIINYLSFFISSFIPYIILANKAEIILVYHPPLTTGLSAAIISLVNKTPFVLEIQDMWFDAVVASGFLSNNPIIGILEKIALFVYKKASAITVISHGFKKNLEDKGVNAKKISVLYNWASDEEYATAPRISDLSQEFGLTGYFNILYAGNMGPAQSLHNAIKAASLLTDIKDLQFIFVGAGTEVEKLKSLAQSYKLSNIKFFPRMPMEKIHNLYSACDATMVHLRNDAIFDIYLPSKTQSCLFFGRPMIVSVSGEATELISRIKSGLTAKPMDAEDLAGAIRKLYLMPKAQREEMGRAGKEFYRQNMASDIQIKKYEDLFKRLAL